MAWQDTSIQMLRVLINDLDSPPTYTDDRLLQVLTVAAQFVNQELTFDYSYTVNVLTLSLSPDPTSVSDDPFLNFMVLKAACIADFSTFRTKALLAGVKAKIGPAALETLRHLDGFKELLNNGPCKAYEKLKYDWTFGGGELIEAVLSPFVSNDFDARNLSNYTGHRGQSE